MRLPLFALAVALAVAAVPSWPGPVRAAEVPGTVALDGLSFRRGSLTIAIPHIEARGTALSAGELREVLDPSSALSPVQRLARLSAAEIEAPEVTFGRTSAADGVTGWTVTLHGLRLSGVEAGKVQALTVASLDGELRPTATKRDAISAGAIAAHALDPVLALDIVSGSRTDPALPVSTVCGDLAVSSLRIAPGPADALLVERLEIAGLRGRPLRDTPRDILHDFDNLFDTPWDATAGTADRTRFYELLIDAAGSLALDRLAVSGTSLTASDEALRAHVGRLELDDLRPASLGRFELGDVDVRTGTVHAAVHSALATGLGFATAADALMGHSFDHQPTGGVALSSEARVEGLSLDLPAADDGPFPPGTVNHVAVPVMESGVNVSADQGLSEGHLRGSVRYDMPPGGNDPTLQMIRELGLDRVDASFNYAISFDAKAGMMRLDELSVAGRDIGSLALSGRVAGLPVAELRTAITREQRADVLAASRFQNLSATLVDRGLLDRVLAVAARQAGSTPAQVRANLEARIARGLPALLGRSRQESEVAAALGRFLDAGGTLELTARSAAGIAFREMGEAADPVAVASRLDIAAKAHP